MQDFVSFETAEKLFLNGFPQPKEISFGCVFYLKSTRRPWIFTDLKSRLLDGIIFAPKLEDIMRCLPFEINFFFYPDDGEFKAQLVELFEGKISRINVTREDQLFTMFDLGGNESAAELAAELYLRGRFFSDIFLGKDID